MEFRCPDSACLFTFEDGKKIKEHLKEEHMTLYESFYESINEDEGDKNDKTDKDGGSEDKETGTKTF